MERLQVTTRRASYSKIANEIEAAFNFLPIDIHVSENAPCSIKYGRTTPKKEGWVEVEKRSDWVKTVGFYMARPTTCAIHIKTATLSGRSRVWVLDHYLSYKENN